MSGGGPLMTAFGGGAGPRNRRACCWAILWARPKGHSVCFRSLLSCSRTNSHNNTGEGVEKLPSLHKVKCEVPQQSLLPSNPGLSVLKR